MKSQRPEINSDSIQAERAKRLAENLRGGRYVRDLDFDRVYPLSIRLLSATHWTPVEVACRAAELLTQDSNSRVLDVGSGCGKFCIIAALSSCGNFFGVEQRPHLSEVARETAQQLGATQASFIDGNMTELDWSTFDAFYLFNPFYENKLKHIRIDDSVSHNPDKFNRYVEAVRTKLNTARNGTRVITYHGFGGEMPAVYQLTHQESIGPSILELWIKEGQLNA